MYTKFNSATGQVYVGRTSGCGTPKQNVSRRDSSHEYNSLGFGEAQLDVSTTSRNAIRGREQQLVDDYRSLGVYANKINGISPSNLMGTIYMKAATAAFGPVG